nr:hypothetical protein [Pandoravirus massiliensis]
MTAVRARVRVCRASTACFPLAHLSRWPCVSIASAVDVEALYSALALWRLPPPTGFAVSAFRFVPLRAKGPGAGLFFFCGPDCFPGYRRGGPAASLALGIARSLFVSHLCFCQCGT